MSTLPPVPARSPFEWSVTVTSGPIEGLAPVLATLRQAGSTAIQVWREDVKPGDDDGLAAYGLVPYRDLLQLRCPLPAAPSALTTRSFTPGDAETFLAVNNRAFAWHPEQSGMTLADLNKRMAEPWFDPDGLRLHEIDGTVAAFCWTKVHANRQPPLGEIYVIAVDPAWHGRGLGRAMTLAGLEHLSSRGLTGALLYVESDNVPALATYERIGFVHHSTNRAYRAAA
jgi:mycothiol synthase